ncbi:21805_t:CDS:2, partial [Dentiscutata erythropus]
KESIIKFKEEVKNGKRADLTKTEKSEGWDKLVHIKQAKIVRSKDRIDSTMQKLRSKGYGFLEYTQHSHALAALRYLNNNPDIFGEKRRFIVEFAIENNIILKKRTGLSRDESNNNLKRKVEMIKSEDQTKKKVKTFHKRSPKSRVNKKTTYNRRK